jgi:glycosyltransferase involved in cell wall biosynthesis
MNLLVTTNYRPEPTGIALYTSDLAEVLNQSGISCTVLTSLPHYPWWEVPAEFADQIEGNHTIGGVKVVRSRHFIPRNFNAISRARFEFSLFRNLHRVGNEITDCDSIIACIPTLAALYVALSLKRRTGAPLGVIVQDLSGKGASQSGQRGGWLVAKIAEWIEVRAIKRADSVVVVSQSMRTALLEVGISEALINLIPNYSVRKLEPLDKTEARMRLGWPSSDFIGVHTGNMGAKQDLGNLIKVGRNLPPNVQIKIIGHGNQESTLQAQAREVSAVDVLPAVSDEEYPYVLAAADVLLVNERATQIDMSLPSKLTSYLFSGRPVLAAVPLNGATAMYLKGLAAIVPAGDPGALVKGFLELRNDELLRNQLAEAGLDFARKNLSPEVGRKKYLEWVEGLIAQGKNR